MMLRILCIFFVFFSLSSVYCSQNLKITILDCCKKNIDNDKKIEIENIIFNFFENESYEVTGRKNVKEILDDLGFSGKILSDPEAVQIGTILNSSIILKYKFYLTKKKIIFSTKCLKQDNGIILFDNRLVIEKDKIDQKKIFIFLKELDSIIKNEKYNLNNEKNTIVKRTIMIMPFYNINKIKNYDYFSSLIRDAVRTELLQEDLFLFTDFSVIDNAIKNSSLEKEKLFNKKYANELASKLEADVVITGKYLINKNNIKISISALDIIKDEIITVTEIDGKSANDLLYIMDEAVKDIRVKLKENIKMVSSSYFEKMEKLNNKNSIYTDIKGSKYWKRHFFDINLGMGFYLWTDAINSSYGFNAINEAYGSSVSCNFGYIYGFNKYFGFGPGCRISIGMVYIDINMFDSGRYFIITAPAFFGVFRFMWGDLMDKKIAFLLDIGGGYLFTIHIGFMYKNFDIKLGYDFSGMGTGHNFTLSAGIMLNWKRKKKLKKKN